MLVKDFTDGAELDVVLLVRRVESQRRRDGSEFLRLQLGDRSGQVSASVAEGADALAEVVRAATPLRVRGRFTRHPQHGAHIEVRDAEPPEPGSFSFGDLLDGPPRSAELMEQDLRGLIA